MWILGTLQVRKRVEKELHLLRFQIRLWQYLSRVVFWQQTMGQTMVRKRLVTLQCSQAIILSWWLQSSGLDWLIHLIKWLKELVSRNPQPVPAEKMWRLLVCRIKCTRKMLRVTHRIIEAFTSSCSECWNRIVAQLNYQQASASLRLKLGTYVNLG